MWWTQGLFVLPKKKYKVVSSKGHSYEAFLVHLTNSNAVSLVLDIRRSNLQSAIKVLCFIMSRYSRPPNSSLYVRNVPSNERFVFNCWICAMTFSRKHVLLFIVLHDQTWQPNRLAVDVRETFGKRFPYIYGSIFTNVLIVKLELQMKYSFLPLYIDHRHYSCPLIILLQHEI